MKKLRNMLTDKIEIDNNLEFDYLSDPTINFDEFPTSEKIYVVTQLDINRIDFISFKVYGNPNYWWVLAKRNNIVDTHNDLSVGMKLYIPNLSDLISYLNKKRKPTISNGTTYSRRKL